MGSLGSWLRNLFRSPSSSVQEPQWYIAKVVNRTAVGAVGAVVRFIGERPSDYRHLGSAIQIAWRYGESGLPSNEQNGRMNEFEAAIDALAASPSESRLAWVRMGFGQKEWLFYANDRHAFMAAFNRCLAGGPSYPLQLSFQRDPSWELWREFIVPLKSRAQLKENGVAVAPDSERRFWEWFTRHSDRIFHFEEDQHEVFKELSEELGKLHENLGFEFGPIVDERREFIISANGDKAAFSIVQNLARAAPAFNNWIVIPFRPPKNLNDFTSISYEGYTMSVDDIWFSYVRDGSMTKLDLYIRGYDPHDEKTAAAAAFLLLDVALGEYVVATQVGTIERHPLPADPSAEGLLPFIELPDVISVPTQ